MDNEYLELFDVFEEPNTTLNEIIERMNWLHNLIPPTVSSLKFYEMYYPN